MEVGWNEDAFRLFEWHMIISWEQDGVRWLWSCRAWLVVHSFKIHHLIQVFSHQVRQKAHKDLEHSFSEKYWPHEVESILKFCCPWQVTSIAFIFDILHCLTVVKWLHTSSWMQITRVLRRNCRLRWSQSRSMVQCSEHPTAVLSCWEGKLAANHHCS